MDLALWKSGSCLIFEAGVSRMQWNLRKPYTILSTNYDHSQKNYFLRSEKKVGSHYFMLKIIKFWAYSFSGKWHCHFYASTLKLFCRKSRLFMANLGVLTCRKIILHHFSVFIFISRSCFNLFLSIFWKDYFSLKTSTVKKIAHFLPIFDKKNYGMFRNSSFSLKILIFRQNTIKHQL